jgi:hypothetical protein
VTVFIEEDATQLAMFLQQKDAHEYGVVKDGVAHPLWDEADPLARERYLKDAAQLLVAVQILGYSKGVSS